MPKMKKLNIFRGMKEALRDAAKYERGEAVDLRVTEVPAKRKKPFRPSAKHT
jgi:hypothetical protein